MQYTESQLTKLIEDVEKEFTAHLAKAEGGDVAPLMKAEDGKKPPEKEKKPEETKPEGEPKPEDKKPEDEPTSNKPPTEGGHDYDDEDMTHLKKMYMSMSKAELKVHHDAIAEIAKCGDMSMAETQEPPMAKSEETKPVVEVKPETIQVDPEATMLKAELAVANDKLEKLQKNFDAVQAFLTKLVEKKAAPAAKAITNLDAVTKDGGSNTGEEKTLSKSEIDSILTKKSQDPTLKKSEREAINDYYLSGNYDVKGISHLLK
jgi:hypothetical protein